MLEYKLTDDGVLIEVENNLTDEVMKEVSTTATETNFEAQVPTKIGFWQKFKNAMFKQVDLLAPVDFKLRLTPYEFKVLNEVKEFWTQDIRNEFKWN